MSTTTNHTTDVNHTIDMNQTSDTQPAEPTTSAVADHAGRARHVDTDGFTRKVLNPTVAWLARRGVGLAGARLLEVRGRTSGEWRSTPVNPLSLDGAEYLVAPRGHTQWVRNLRAAGAGQLRKGRTVRQFTAVELDDAEKPAVLRAYLDKWRWEVGAFFEGVGPDASDEELLAIAPGYPVFLITRS